MARKKPQKKEDSVCTLEDILNDKECLKICVFNISKRKTLAQIEAALKDIPNFEYSKCRRFTQSTYFHLLFDTAELKEKNFPIFVEHWKPEKNELKFGKAKVLPAKKRERDDSDDSTPNKKKIMTYEDDKQAVVSVTAPYCGIPYEDQLSKKEDYVKTILKKITKTTFKESNKQNLPKWLSKIKKQNFPCCEFEKIYSSEIKEGYRNKNSFTIGRDRNLDPIIGFTLGAVKDDIVTVADPQDCKITSARTIKTRNFFQEYIGKSALPPFDKLTKQGFWRYLTLKEFTTGDGMAIIQVQTTGFTDDQVKEQKDQLIAYCKENDFKDSVLWQEWNGISNVADSSAPIETLLGTPYSWENMLGLSFRISPNAFFQVNLKSAETLYTIARDWAKADQNTVIVDVCCGTGTIGLTMAKSVKKVIGIELESSAVEDAIFNATHNKIENATFISGKAEDVINSALSSITNENVVAIVDPPRPGLHNDVLKALRKCSQISKIVYISCNPNSLVQNASLLCRAKSKGTQGSPFRPVIAAAVDMFPHTDNVEAIMLFERDLDDTTNNESTTIISDDVDAKSSTVQVSHASDDGNNNNNTDDLII